MQCEVGTSLGHVRCSLALALVELVLHWNLAELVHWVHWPPWAVEVFVLLVHWVLLALPWVAGLSVRWHLFFSTGGGSLNGGGCLKLSDATGATASDVVVDGVRPGILFVLLGFASGSSPC